MKSRRVGSHLNETAYDVLNVTLDSSDADIKKAYKKMSQKCHPDKYTEPEDIVWAEEQMQKINAAFELIDTEEKRKVYNGHPLYTEALQYVLNTMMGLLNQMRNPQFADNDPFEAIRKALDIQFAEAKNGIRGLMSDNRYFRKKQLAIRRGGEVVSYFDPYVIHIKSVRRGNIQSIRSLRDKMEMICVASTIIKDYSMSPEGKIIIPHEALGLLGPTYYTTVTSTFSRG